MRVTVTCHGIADDDEDFGWELEFVFSGRNATHTFLVEEPYARKLSAWRALAAGECKLQLYGGNGEGSIEASGGVTSFVAAPSGAGGDVRSTFRIASAKIAAELSSALDEAERLGYRFA